MRFTVLLSLAMLPVGVLFHASAVTNPQYVYVGNAGDTSISVFQVNAHGTLKPLEPRVISPTCGTPTFLVTAGKVLLAAGDYTAVCNQSGELGGALIYLYPILPSGKLGPVSQAFENDVEGAALNKTGKLAFTSATSFNPHSFQVSISGWQVSAGNLNTSLPGSPYSFFFNSQTGDGYLPYSLQVAGSEKFLYGVFSGVSGFNLTRAGLLGVMSLLSDGGVGSFVTRPVKGCKGTGVTGLSGTLVVVKLKSEAVAYQPCLQGTAKQAIGYSTINPWTGVITKTHSAFEPPSGMSLAPVAVDPSGHWLAASNGAGKVVILAIDQTTGALSEPAHHIFSLNANNVAFDHTDKFLYAAQTSSNRVAAFAFHAVTGVIVMPALGTQGTGPSPTVVVVAH